MSIETDPTASRKEAQRLVDEAVVIDVTLPWRDYGDPVLRSQTLPRMKACGYSFVSLTLDNDSQTRDQVIELIAKQRRFFLSRPDEFVLVEGVDDILRAKQQDKLAVGFHFQGTNALQRDIGMVELYYKLGVRFMLLAYNRRNHVGDGCHEPADAGLSEFGAALIAEMERVGMAVDLSHTGYRTTLQALERATRPVMFSHSNPRALCDHERNIRDDQILACARTEGMLGVNGLGLFLPGGQATTDALADVVEYYAELVGPQHIGLGLDFIYDLPGLMRNISSAPASAHPSGKGYEDATMSFFQPEQLTELAETLARRGYADADILGVLGGNWLRFFKQVWR